MDQQRQVTYRAPGRSVRAGSARRPAPDVRRQPYAAARQQRPGQGTSSAGRGGEPPRRQREMSYRRYAARRRRRRRLCLLLFAAAALLLAGTAAFLLLHTGMLEGPAQPVSARMEEPQEPGAPAAESKFVVAVDPGHGGSDPGNISGDFYERYMTWDTANELMALLDDDGRFAPFLTLSEEEATNPEAPRIKPSERAARAEAQGAQLLVSIHGNSDPVYGASGFECYPVPPGRTHYEQSMALALKFAEGFGAEGSRLRGANGVRFMYYDDNNVEQFVESTDTTVNMDSTYTVLENAPCPAVLVEQCFVTNAADLDKFGDEDGCKLSASILYRAICQWYEENFPQQAA